MSVPSHPGPGDGAIERRRGDVGERAETIFETPRDCDRLRADKAIHRNFPHLSRSFIQKLFDAGLVWRENEALGKSDKARAGDVLSFTIPPPQPLELTPAAIPLDILHEDDDYVIVNKAPGMIVHPGAGTGPDTLVHALLDHCHGRLSGIGGVERPGIVHRLDKETSGVIAVAKSDRAYRALSRQLSERRVEKEYLALVQGTPERDSGSIEASLGRHPVHRMKMCVRADGRAARSDWWVEGRPGFGYTLLRVRIHTGRTHQIRVHCAHARMPVAGDTTYGFRRHDSFSRSVPRVMLHARRLAFAHPATGTQCAVEAPLTADFSGVLEELRAHAES